MKKKDQHTLILKKLIRENAKLVYKQGGRSHTKREHTKIEKHMDNIAELLDQLADYKPSQATYRDTYSMVDSWLDEPEDGGGY